MFQFIDKLALSTDVFSWFFNFHFFSSLYPSLGFSLSQEQYCFICISTRCHGSYLGILSLYVPGHTAEISSANPLVKLGTDSKFLGLVFDLWVQKQPLFKAFSCLRDSQVYWDNFYIWGPVSDCLKLQKAVVKGSSKIYFSIIKVAFSSNTASTGSTL